MSLKLNEIYTVCIIIGIPVMAQLLIGINPLIAVGCAGYGYSVPVISCSSPYKAYALSCVISGNQAEGKRK